MAPSSGHFEVHIPQSPSDAGFDRFRNLRPLCVHTAHRRAHERCSPPLSPCPGCTHHQSLVSITCNPRGLRGLTPPRGPVSGALRLWVSADTPSLAFHPEDQALGPRGTLGSDTARSLCPTRGLTTAPPSTEALSLVGSCTPSARTSPGRADTMTEGHHHHHPFHHPALRGAWLQRPWRGRPWRLQGAAILSLIRTAVDSVFQAAATFQVLRQVPRHASLLRMTPILQTWRLRLRKLSDTRAAQQKGAGQTIAGGGQGTNTTSQPLRWLSSRFRNLGNPR